MIIEVDSPDFTKASKEEIGKFLDHDISGAPNVNIVKAEAIELNGYLGRYVTALGPKGPFTMTAFVRQNHLIQIVAAPNPQNPASAAAVAESARSFTPNP